MAPTQYMCRTGARVSLVCDSNGSSMLHPSPPTTPQPREAMRCTGIKHCCCSNTSWQRLLSSYSTQQHHRFIIKGSICHNTYQKAYTHTAYVCYPATRLASFHWPERGRCKSRTPTTTTTTHHLSRPPSDAVRGAPSLRPPAPLRKKPPQG